MPKENFLDYLYEKRTELNHLGFRDLLLAKAVTDIHRYSIKQQEKIVPLWSINPIHTLDRESALDKLQQRIEQLQQHRQSILNAKVVTRKTLLDILPSVSGIKVIYDKDNNFISFEGNGRLAAFKQVFNPKDKIMIEVEVYRLTQRDKVLRRVNRVIKRNF